MPEHANVAALAFLLGASSASATTLLATHTLPSIYAPILVYLLALSTFHFLEFFITALFNPARVSVQSFLLNNGLSYHLAQAACVLEFFFNASHSHHSSTHSFLPAHSLPIISISGLLCSVVGQLLRSLAMITAAQSFNHTVSTHQTKQDDHLLVTDGIYRFIRHPSYFGFFWWSIGIQIYLGNRFCLIIFSVILWRFFNHRIKFEEKHLVKFFGQSYLDYRSRTSTWIPFIR